MLRKAISLLFLLTAVGIFLAWTNPLIDEIKVLKNHRNDLVEILEESRELQQLQSDLVTRTNAISGSSLEKFGKMIPKESETEKLMVELSTIAQSKGVLLKNIDFSFKDGKGASVAASQSLVAPKKYQTADISLSISATYESFKIFLSEIEKSLRILDVEDITFDSGKINLYDFNIKASAYFDPKGGGEAEMASNQIFSKEADFLKSVNKLKAIKIDSSFFDSDSFRFFVDLTPEIVLPKDFGRKNPFLPIDEQQKQTP